ncbi:MAG: FG-GAP repeat domain-containing protein [Pseudomonadales bacterium]
MFRALVFAFFYTSLAACGGGGGGGGGLSQIGNPGAPGPLGINASVSTGTVSVEQGSEASFTLTAEVINQGDYSRGLTITAGQGCLQHSVCRSEPHHFSTSGTSTVTIYTNMNTPAGTHTLEVTVYEEHYTALGGLGPRVHVSKEVPVTVNVAPATAVINFDVHTMTESSIEEFGGIHVGDFNADAVADILGSASYGMWELLLGSANGDFESIDIDFGVSARDVLLADINRDGHEDVVTTTANGFSYYERIDVSLTYAEPQRLLEDSDVSHIEYFDANGDSAADFLAYSRGESSVTLVEVSESGLAAGEMSSIEGYVAELDRLDYDGDGNIDLVTAGDEVAIYRNGGAGEFTKAFDALPSIPTHDLVVTDINGDSVKDLVLAQDSQDRVTVLLGDGSAGFFERVNLQTSSRAQEVAVADIDRDGLPDIVALTPDLGRVSVLLNRGGSTFDEGIHFTAGRGARTLETGDFNGDGWTDIAMSGWGNRVLVLFNRG